MDDIDCNSLDNSIELIDEGLIPIDNSH